MTKKSSFPTRKNCLIGGPWPPHWQATASGKCLFHRKQLSTIVYSSICTHLKSLPNLIPIKHQSFGSSSPSQNPILHCNIHQKLALIYFPFHSLLLMIMVPRPPITYLHHPLKVAVTLGFIFSLSFLPSHFGNYCFKAFSSGCFPVLHGKSLFMISFIVCSVKYTVCGVCVSYD